LELELQLQPANRIFSIIDMVGNFGELVSGDQDAWHQWEDAGQFALGFALTFGTLGPVAIVAGGIVLTAWELWEYRRDH
jgi:cytochrome c biogenesis protein CcdA